MHVPPGADLLSAARQAGIDLNAVCSGLGICGACKLRLISGRLSPLTAAEEEALSADQLARGYRLACQAVPQTDVRVVIPPESLPAGQRMQLEGKSAGFELHPAVTAAGVEVDLSAVDKDPQRAFGKVLSRIGWKDEAPHASPAGLVQLLTVLQENEGCVKLALGKADGESWLAGAYAPGVRLLGLAVDLGSTKLAAYLLDLENGTALAQSGLMNPQIAYGEDVISRIAYANRSEENRLQLQTRLVEALNQTAGELCAQAGASVEQIVDIVAAGNTAMHHFLGGFPVRQLGEAPYEPHITAPQHILAASLGLRLAPGARVFLPANIAGYVGGDHTAALLSSGIVNGRETAMLVDIGTNTEISLVQAGRIHTCSAASGPAFEGAHIRDGMRAAPGAIDKVRITPDGVTVSVIQNPQGDARAAGICGTGILQAVAEMLNAGLIEPGGRFNRADRRLRIDDKHTEFVLVPGEQSASGRNIAVTRRDVNEIQLAKSAIRSGIDVLLAEAGLQVKQVQRWVIAGAFGTWLDVGSAVRTGMFPPAPLARFEQIGNAAGMGARQMLLSIRARAESAAMVAGVRYVELTTYPDFADLFMRNMGFEDISVE